jgi:neutral ceramidase
MHLELPLPKPQWRLGRNLKLRPWVFYLLYGRYPAWISLLKTGPVCWGGIPADFSGELALEIEKHFSDNPLIVISFNGGYIGYITPDWRYDLRHYETRVMNWFGPGNGSYLTEALLKGFKLLKN